MYIPYTLMSEAHRQRLEDAGVIKANRPDPALQLRLSPAAQNRVRGLRLRLIAMLPVFIR